MTQHSVQGSSAPINIPMLARQRFAGFKDDEDEQHTGIIPPHLLAAQVSLEMTERSSLFCLPPHSAWSRCCCSQALLHPICWLRSSDTAQISLGWGRPGCVPLSLHLLIDPERNRYHPIPGCCHAGHLVCQLPHTLASWSYMHLCL